MQKVESPKFILSKSKVLEQYNKLRPLTNLISYSSKTNPLITPILEENTDSLFSIHLANELKHVKDKSRVLFFAQAWSEEDVQSLTTQGIRFFTVDNEKDLDTLLSFLEKTNLEIDLLLRLKLKEKTLRTERYFVFGMTSQVINKRLEELANYPKIKNLGIHFHRKTQNMAEWDYIYEISSSISEENLKKISLVNMGGGLPSDYANTNVDVIKTVFKKIQEFKAWLSVKNIKLILEPGRFISAPSVRLVTTILSIYENNIIVNASVYNSDMDALIVPVKLLVEGEASQGQPYIIKGITPCSLDLFRYRVYLDNPKPGDKIVFLNAGAYNFKTDFCDLDEIETEIVD